MVMVDEMDDDDLRFYIFELEIDEGDENDFLDNFFYV